MVRAEPASLRLFIELARPAQWIKNGFVLLPLFFGHALLQAGALRGALLATLAFCLAASAVYAGNDVVDAERDRNHPDKSGRPLARGALDPRVALGFSTLLACVALVLGWFVAPGVGWVLLAYLGVQVAYSLALKRIAYLDAAIVASGFVLRLVAGGIAAGVPLTPWIVVMGFVLALMLALGKRHGDLAHGHDPTARAALGYHRHPLEWVLAGLGGLTLASYVFYTLSPEVLARHGHHPLAFSTPWVVLGILRYLWLVLGRGAGGDPSRLALRDPLLLVAVAGWLVTLGVILYPAA